MTFRGVRVGAVQRVKLVIDPAKLQARIPVYLELERRQVTFVTGPPKEPALLRSLIEAGLRAKLTSQSLVTGQMLVELDLNPDAPAHLMGTADPSVPEIPAVSSDLEQLRQQLTRAPIAETVAQALRTLAAIEKLSDQVGAEVGPLAASAREALDSAGRAMAIAGGAVQHLEGEAAGTLDEARGLARDGRRQLAVRGDELSRLLVDADKAVHAVNGLIGSANTLIGTANALIAPHAQARSDLEALLRDLAASASAIRDFSHTIERDPSTVLRGRASR